MAVLYGLTLSWWGSFESVTTISQLSGFSWRLELFGPVTWGVTYPIRALPARWVPLALNVFAAVGGAVVLGVLARSVVLLPHEQTAKARHRLIGEGGSEALARVWVPPVLAVLACGLELTFWEQATCYGGEMVDLLLFAVMVWCLLEYRAKKRKGWLLGFSLVYGLGVADSWSLVAFGVCFFVMLLLITGNNPLTLPFWERIAEGMGSRSRPWFQRVQGALRVFDWGLAARMAGCFLLGLSCIALLPLRSGKFLPSLALVLRTYSAALASHPRPLSLLVSVSPVVLVLFIGLGWSRPRKHAKPYSERTYLVAGVFKCVQGLLLLGGCVWTMLDAPLSPRALRLGYAFMPIYYLAALSIGYFSGYFLRIFTDVSLWAQLRLSGLVRLMVRAVPFGMWGLLLALPAGLLWKNGPAILRASEDLPEYAAQLERSLPPPGAIILSHDPLELAVLENTLARKGKKSAYLLIDATLLSLDPTYLPFLQRENPAFWPELATAHGPGDKPKPADALGMLLTLANQHELYALHYIPGTILEAFSAKPYRLLYRLQPYRSGLANPPELTPEELESNLSFWRDLEPALPDLTKRIQEAQEVPGGKRVVGRLLERARWRPEAERGAVMAGNLYARALNAWGVTLQRLGRLAEAGRGFDRACQLNPANAAARINREFNQDYQAHKPVAVQAADEIDSRWGMRRSWRQVLQADGPIDEPNSCYQLGWLFEQAALFRQARQQMRRVVELAPAYPETGSRLAELAFALADYTNALVEADRVLQGDPHDRRGLYLKGAAHVEIRQFAQALVPLTSLLAIDSTNLPARVLRGFANFQLGNLEAAAPDYEAVVQANPQAYPAYLMLAQIASARGDANRAIKNYELYLAIVPARVPDRQRIEARLAELKGDENAGKP